jgi:decaprenylphospho-beta-D-erythro-pentofuranosid-2-ulose 2-reductase
VLIVGGRSDIGLATARHFAAEGRTIQLAARNAATLDADRRDIELRHGVSVSLHELDLLDTAAVRRFVADVAPLPDIAVCLVGLLGDQAVSEQDLDAATAVMRSNFEAPAAVLTLLANRFAERGSGTLVVVSSVAGERGRASNYVYGAAKAGLTAFASGLRNRLLKRGVHVATVLPGFVDTRMTAGMDLPKPLTASAQEVAAAIARAVRRRQDVTYVRFIWRPIMTVIRAIPEPLFKRLKL